IEKKTMSTSLTTLCESMASTVGRANLRTTAYGLPLVTMFLGASEGGAAICCFGVGQAPAPGRLDSGKGGAVHPAARPDPLRVSCVSARRRVFDCTLRAVSVPRGARA